MEIKVRESLRESSRPWEPVTGDEMGWRQWETMCVRAAGRGLAGLGGGHTCVSISNVCPNKCVYVCFLCTIVTGGVYFGSLHWVTAKTSNKILQGGWTS